jgi:hypothetical protein
VVLVTARPGDGAGRLLKEHAGRDRGAARTQTGTMITRAAE